MTTKRLIVLLLVQSTLIMIAHGQQDKKFFRKDYTYISKAFGFYKIHTLHRTWQNAKKRCAMEGATLYFPEDQNEADAVHTFWNETQPQFFWVYIGVSDLIAKGVFETIDGRPISDVYNNWSPGEPNDANGVEDCVILRRESTINDDRCDRHYPFICKKPLEALVWNKDCDMPNTDYKFNQGLGKCYKFHLTPKNWTEAYLTCHAEQSYLAVINSQQEADHLVSLNENAKKDKVTGDFLAGAVHLGFHQRDGEGWKTVRGSALTDSGYSTWGNKQPDGGDQEQCGSMFYNGHYNDVSCDRRCFFICEHDIGTMSNDFDERVGDN